MEKQPDTNERVQITRAVFDGLEFIKQSGATNMLDRPTVLALAQEWGFIETAEWIEQVDTGTYGRLILQGPDVVEADRADTQVIDGLDAHDHGRTPAADIGDSKDGKSVEDIDVTEMAVAQLRETMHNLLPTLGKQAILTIADTYGTQRMGVLVNPSRNDLIARERDALIRSLGEASSLWQQLDQAMTGIERGIGSLQYLIDPENN